MTALRQARCMKDIATVILCGLIVSAAVVLHATYLLPNHDNEWLLIASERLLAGGTYRTEIVEPVPPLILVLNIPAVILAKLTGLATYTAFSLYVGGCILLSAALAARPLATILT